ncbi:MAG: hypothetical protein LBB67_06920 [Oscillospiraceae bacterium]|jgi:hypothetical protein|nr:hypothetical protein [Oscillospiraceae bacterium]
MGIFRPKTQDDEQFCVSFRFVEDDYPGATFHRIHVSASVRDLQFTSECRPERDGWTFLRFSPPMLYNIAHNEVIDVHYARRLLTVTFTDERGAMLPDGLRYVRYGDDADPPFYNPENASFGGWNADLKNITQDCVIAAIAIPKRHTVYFLDGKGKVIGTPCKVLHGESAQPPVMELPETETFIGWSRSTEHVYQDLFVVALTQPKPTESTQTYIVTFCDEDGVPLEATPRSVRHGCAVMPPAYAPKGGVGFLHTGWNAELSSVVKDMVVRATVDQKTYAVRFLREDGSLIQSLTVKHGEAAPLPRRLPPLPEGSIARRWKGDVTHITEDCTIQEIFERETYFVAFYDPDGFELDEQIVAHGDTVQLPDFQPPQGYRFTGWKLSGKQPNLEPFLQPNTLSIAEVKSDQKYIAQCEAVSCRVMVLDLRESENAALLPMASMRYGTQITQNDLQCLHLRAVDRIAAFGFTVQGDTIISISKHGVRVFDFSMQIRSSFSLYLAKPATASIQPNIRKEA